MLIRPETPNDYAAIADVTARAFDNRTTEPMVVLLHRQRQRFDPDLSLVAEVNGNIVGHVLFSPQTIRLLGHPVRAVNLAPISVHPAKQKQGIGAVLIEEGHRIAREKGYALSFLLGHPTYYPRFGYQTHVYGDSWLSIKSSSQADISLESRPLQPDDVPVLVDLWQHEEGKVDFAIEPEAANLDWVSPNPQVESTVYLHGNRIVGYTRQRDKTIQVFLANSHEVARAMVAMIGNGIDDIRLPLHPHSASATAFGEQPQVQAWEAGMACPLAASPFDDYIAHLQKGEIPVGRPTWGVAFDL